MNGEMTMTNENATHFSYSRRGLRVEVFTNRIEFEAQVGLRKERGAIPIRSVASVESVGSWSLFVKARRLRVRTNDGQEHEWMLGSKDGESSDDARQAIRSLM